jgi:hypothetical protein
MVDYPKKGLFPQDQYEVRKARAIGGTGTAAQAERIRANSLAAELPLDWFRARIAAKKEKTGALSAGSAAVETGMKFADWLGPIALTILTFFLIMGPGMAVLYTLLTALSWWMWVIGIFIVIYIWRSR